MNLQTIEFFYSNKEFDKATELTIRFLVEPIHSDWLCKIMEAHCEKGMLNNALDVARLISEEQRREPVEILIKRCVECEYATCLKEATLMIGRTQTVKESEDLIRAALWQRWNSPSFGDEVVQAAVKFLPARKRHQLLEEILVEYLDAGDRYRSETMAKLLGRKLSVEEINRLLDHCRPGWPFHWIDAVNWLPIAERARKLVEIFEKSITSFEYDNATVAIRLLTDETLKLLLAQKQ